MPNANNPRHQAVLLRESGLSAAEVAKAVGLSAPTVLSLHKAFKAGGWASVDERSRGRPRAAETLTAPTALATQFATDNTTLWNTERLAAWLSQAENKTINARAAQRRMSQWGWLPATQALQIMLLTLISRMAITPASAQTITWSEHIAPILYENCTQCHIADVS